MDVSAGARSWRSRLGVDFRVGLSVQSALSRLICPLAYHPLLFYLKFVRGYKIAEIQKIRASFNGLLAETKDDPLLICANHLTMIDSALIMWSLSPGWKCILESRRFPWNLPERTIFSDRWWRTTLCYLARCLPITRNGPPGESKRVLENVATLLGRGDSVLIFPEGGRSRIGRIDVENFSYGVGMIAQSLPNVRIVCVFSRGGNQAEYSILPRRGETFFVQFKLLNWTLKSKGLRGAREIALQVIENLAAMEHAYFASHSSSR